MYVKRMKEIGLDFFFQTVEVCSSMTVAISLDGPGNRYHLRFERQLTQSNLISITLATDCKSVVYISLNQIMQGDVKNWVKCY